MADQPTGGPPPVAAKPNVVPIKRAGLKRTFSAGASPKKSQIVSNAKLTGVSGGSVKWAAGATNSGQNGDATGVPKGNGANSLGANGSSSNSAYSDGKLGVESGNLAKTQSTTLPGLGGAIGDAALSPARPRSRPPSGSFSSSTVTSSRIAAQFSLATEASSSGTGPGNVARVAPGRLSIAAYANFSGEQSGYTGPLSPRSAERKAESEEYQSQNGANGESTDPNRPRRPAAPPRPTTLRSPAARASVSAFSSTETTPRGSVEDALSGSSPKPNPATVKTGAQMRPPVPKKNISQAVLHPDLSSSSPNNSPPSSLTAPLTESGSGYQTSSPLRPRALAQDIPASPSTSRDGVDSDEPHTSSSPVLKRTQTPRSLAHFRSPSAALSSNIITSPSEPQLLSTSSPPSSGTSTPTMDGKEIDERGRVVTVGKPRSQDYYQLDLAALDLDTGKKKSSGLSMKLGVLAKGIANSVKPRRSPSESSLEGSDEGEVVDTSGWPMVKRTKLEWPELVTEGVPADNLKMIDLAPLKDGFHVEFGDASITTLPTTLGLDHCGEYVPYYKSVLYGVDHSNYVAYDDESDLYWVVSIEEKPKGKRQDQLRALVRNRKDYIRINIDIASLSTSFTDNFSKGSSVKMTALSKLIPELEKLKWVRVKNPDLNDELASMEEKEVRLGSSYKFGVLYVRPGQTEDEIFANNDPKPEFAEFLDMLGTKIELFGWDKYRGGLDVKNKSTGEHSVYHEIHGVSVMFHVCTMLPSQENDVQRVERKRHIGNDVVTFVYLEEGCEPYLATKLTSQFIHIHYVIQKVVGTGGTSGTPAQYRVAVVTKYGVEPHMPSLAHPAVYTSSPALRDFLITKAINSERTAMLATEFRSKMLRARKDFLKHLYENFSANKKKARASSSARHDA